MKFDAHEAVQRYLAGQSSDDDVLALSKALYEDAELRALFLDYANLDAALADQAETLAIADEPGANSTGAAFPGSRAWLPRPVWPWLSAAAAAVALAACFILPKLHRTASAPSETDAAFAAARNSIARLSFDPPPPFPASLSPTASLLEPPALPK
ncbi:MAG TPA: hypothetical protein VGH90_05645 [Chthoniobacteraceae bacterium]|jgi:anti-sigma factor RsiW